MSADVETTVLNCLATDENFARRVIPYMKDEYFAVDAYRNVFRIVDSHFSKYNTLPSREAIVIELRAAPNLNETSFAAARTAAENIVSEKHDGSWLLETAEKFCRDRALYNALIKASVIIEDRSGKSVPDAIPDMLSEALAVGFDVRVGHDYVEDYEKRFDFYHNVEERLPFDVDRLNEITKGGISRKTLTVLLAGTGVGKTMAMCHFAAANVMMGKSVLYITMEMAEEKIAERIDANLLNVSLDGLGKLSKEEYVGRVKSVKSKTHGRLIIKEYPTAGAHSGHFRALLKELKMKKNFTPDVIYVDYINICNSARVKAGGNGVNSYSFIKFIAEELRGLAVEANVPLVTATQLNRAGMASSDVDLTDTSESIGLPFTADLMLAMVSTEDLNKMNQVMFKQLKNRYSDVSTMTRFMVGVDRGKMRLYNLDASADKSLAQDSRQAAPAALPSGSTLSEDMKSRLKQLR